MIPFLLFVSFASISHRIGDSRGRFVIKRFFFYYLPRALLAFGVEEDASYSSEPSVNGSNQFSITLRENNVQEFDTKWYEILFSMTKISPDDVLESLYNFFTQKKRESDQLKTVLELHDMDIHQKRSML